MTKKIKNWKIEIPFEMSQDMAVEKHAREIYIQGLEEIIYRIKIRNDEGIYPYVPPGHIHVTVESDNLNQIFVFNCVFDNEE